jgi:RimJ/RimL family protein N-acetyltransferase
MQPQIDTPRLRLRPLELAHVPLLVDLDSDPAVMRHLTGRPSTPEEVTEVVRASIGHRWAAFEAVTSEFVGWFALWPHGDRPGLELGYRLRRRFWGRGLATEGGRALVAHAFGDLGADRVYAETMVVNVPSRRVLARCGLRYARIFHLTWDDPLPGSDLGEVEYEAHRSAWQP